MLKTVIAGTAMLVIAGSSALYAQQHRGGSDDETDNAPRCEQHHRPSIDDIKAFTDARIAALKAGLQLTADQEKNWTPFEQALRALAKLHIDKMQARQAAGEQPRAPGDRFARMQRRAEALIQFGGALKHVAETGQPLYQSLSEAQKHRFTFLARMLRPHWMRGGHWMHGGGHWMRHERSAAMCRGQEEGGTHGMKNSESSGDGDEGSDSL
jgi:zinc resistance-associated protein